jgi:amidophosphoribosyltransferase
MAISSPPIISPCYYGIDTPRASELIANQKTVEEVARFLGVDTLHYLSQDSMLKAAGSPTGWCTACFSRRYPTPIPDYQVAEAVK